MDEAHVSTAKEEVRRLLDQLPEDVSYEDIHYHLYVRQKVKRGLEDLRDGRVHSHEEVVRDMAQWLSE